MESIKRKDIKPGTIVKIIEKQHQKTGELTEGIVKKILTSSATHPYGIKVILESGIVGRVKEIVNK
ncbi:MAG TPA: YwbE family protein [Nitrososphaeraceae archaeon]